VSGTGGPGEGGAGGTTAPLHLSIGEVLSFLQEEFPDVTISKIRFLESQGLIQPDRTASGYRKFYESDIERLQWILRQQRDHFLPLKVIRKMLDEGVDQFDPGGGAQPTLWTPTPDVDPADAEPEPAAISQGPPRSPAHPAVASSVAAGGSAARATSGPAAGARGAAPDPVAATAGEPSASTPPARPAPGDAAPAGPASGGDPAPRPADAEVPPMKRGDGRTPKPRPTTDPTAPSAGPDRPIASDTGPAVPAGASRGAERSESPAGETTPRVHETPADVVAALQEDPRTARAAKRDRGTAAGAGPSRPTRRAQAPVDPATELTAAELCRDAGIDEALLAGLERYGLVAPQLRGGEQVFGPEALAVGRLAARYAELGIEPRHLRMHLVAVEREAGFVEQLAVPLLKQRNPQARAQAAELAAELSDLGADLHRVLLRRELGPDLLP
jgi:DNA-binding transcriptional MerR regulator